MRVFGTLSEDRRSFEVNSARGSGTKTASTRHAPQDVGSGTSPSKSACNSREGDGLMPSLGKVAQMRLGLPEGFPISRTDGKDSDTALARSLHRSWNGCSDFLGRGTSSELSAHTAKRPPSWSASQLPCRTVGTRADGAAALATVCLRGRVPKDRTDIRHPLPHEGRGILLRSDGVGGEPEPVCAATVIAYLQCPRDRISATDVLSRG